MRKRSHIEEGVRFGKWVSTGVEKYHTYASGKKVWQTLFKCDCGTQKWMCDSEVRNGNSSRCNKCRVDGYRKVYLTKEEKERKKYVDRLWPDE